MVAGGHRIIAGDALNLVVLLYFRTPTHGHSCNIYSHRQPYKTSTVDKTGTTI